MKTLLLQDGDLVISGGRFVWLYGRDACRQRLELSLRLDLGSWFLNPDAGVDWWGIYDAKYVSDRLVRSEVERVIKADPEVTALESLTIEFENKERKLRISFTVATIYGTVTGAI
ncbi:MAG TPA: hypothetical protein PL135_07820 [Spirochaetota bacterium]|nr:hypothetical protein [Spirochaetota bacterium]